MTINYAHRGFSGRYPENTMLAFEKAVEAGADGIELDVQLTRDGVPVIIHNETVNKTTDGKGHVSDFTLEEIKKLDASAGFPGIYGRNEIPTLREYFEMIEPTGLLTDVELKTADVEYPGIEEKVLDLIEEFGLGDRVLISSFNHESILRVKELDPKMKCGFLEKSRHIDMAGYTSRYGIEGINPKVQLVTKKFVREMRDAGIEIYVWTVNKEKDMWDMLQKGVDGMIGNYPDLCRQVINDYVNARSAYA